MTLTDDEKAMLAFERQWWKHAGARDQSIRDRFDLSPVAYFQRLNALIDTEAALAHDPLLVKRLLRVREARRRRGVG